MSDEVEVDDAEAVVEVGELESMRSGRPTTDANVFFQLLFGSVATIATAIGTSVFKNSEIGGLKYLYDIINERGWVQYGELLMAFMVVALMILKSRIVKNQLKVVASNPIPLDIDLSDDEQLHNLRDSLIKRDEFSWSIILNRIDRAIALWLSTKDVARVSGWASAESARDSSSSDSSYSLCRVLIWAIPILGFIGTVMGLAVAVSGFGVLGGSAEIGAIKEAIGQVTLGLGVAFDTTLLALFLTVLLMFPLSFIQRNEEGLFVELDNYLDDMFLARLPSPEQQPIVIENLEDSIEAAFRRYIPDPDRYDEVFTRSIEKAAASIEERFGNLTKNYEITMKEVTGQLAGNLAGVSDSLRKSIVASMEDLQKQDAVMLDARKQLVDEEKKQVGAMLDGVAQTAKGVVGEYQKTAEVLRSATDASMSKSVQAAQQLAAKMDEVSQMAASIKDLLKIEQSIEKSMAGISASDDFRKTLEDLRKHINTTTDFCSRLSKPRVITLREEIT
ncbi:MAG TPA: MotA/TolQ/ExbB proton channel family protein [Kiritimatiellia bacterium]|nr:MotA/TolQ/ExbB proton channel family protein [Kiritimatiellia bacterium]HMO98267.1 MotA/TolQ/ExbB proton channel family protein [Kiritimatiellia bacterium]HMP96264.1 MotA/TolQ/ExbB proton channel family protein [Kiritimatiellia bacterium]